MISHDGVYVVWICVHFFGLLASWLVRMYAGHRHEGYVSLLFLISLPLIASATFIGQYCCMTLWPLSACTLAIMIVTATLDFGRNESLLAGSDTAG